MNFYQLAAERFSVRKFEDRPVAAGDIDLILRAGLLSPTAHNYQPERILVLTEREALEKMYRCTPSHYHAPCAMLVCYDRTESWKREFDGKDSGDIDASIVTTHLMLQAAALGVGSTWVMYFDPAAIRREFELPDRLEPTALLVLGYPAADAAPSAGHSARRAFETLVSFNALPQEA